MSSNSYIDLDIDTLITECLNLRACHCTVGWMTLKLNSYDMIMCHSVKLVLISHGNLPSLRMNGMVKQF